jgi:hypothetical protein
MAAEMEPFHGTFADNIACARLLPVRSWPALGLMLYLGLIATCTMIARNWSRRRNVTQHWRPDNACSKVQFPLFWSSSERWNTTSNLCLILIPCPDHAGQRSGHLRTVDPDVLAAAQAVGLHATIMALPNKYQTVIGAGVHEIGNAEKHLLSLARKNYRVRRKLSRQRATDALWNKKHGTKKLGQVPDFDALHTQWDAKLARARQEMRKATLTVPEVRCFFYPAALMCMCY